MPDAGESVKSPQVFVVDSQVFPCKAPVRRDVPQLQLLYLLLSVALLGVFIEAVCICHLYSRHTPISSNIPRVEYVKGKKDAFTSSAHDSNNILPEKNPKDDSKPAAFLQIDPAATGGNGVLGWRTGSFSVFINKMDLKNKSLYILQNGYYYIFSKISHLENCIFFQHKVMLRTQSYSNTPIELMEGSRFLCVPDKPQSSSERGSSYLGGIFRLSEGDSVFVTVNNSSLVLRNIHENFFGAFMV
ncbi:hypothetical protein R3I94_003846 [Phoxinus phoxinus]